MYITHLVLSENEANAKAFDLDRDRPSVLD